MPSEPEHLVSTYFNDEEGYFGWECTCLEDGYPYHFLLSAERAASEHERSHRAVD